MSGGLPNTWAMVLQHAIEDRGKSVCQVGSSHFTALYCRLYDNNGTMALVKKWVNFYKTYRDIVTSDIVHVRRPNMQGIIHYD